MADFCGLNEEQRKRLAEDPDKFIDEELDGECCGECRALLNGTAERSFWHVLKVFPIFLVILGGGSYLTVHFASLLIFVVTLALGFAFIIIDIILFTKE
jgi:hypothetical protein